MTGKNFKYEKAACIVAEADLLGIEEVAKRWGVSERSVWRYRSLASSDELLAELVKRKKSALAATWLDDAAKVVKVAASDLARRIPLAKDEDDAKCIHAIAGAAKIMGELRITSETLSESFPIIESSDA